MVGVGVARVEENRVAIVGRVKVVPMKSMESLLRVMASVHPGDRMCLG